MKQLNVDVAIVTFETARPAARYAAEMRLPWPVLLDEERKLYRAFGMHRARFWDVWGPKTWLAYAKELARGQRLTRSEADVQQRGGDVLIDPSGIVRLHHVGRGPSDRPKIDDLLDIVRQA